MRKNFVSVSFMILWRQPGQASVSADLRVWCVIRLTDVKQRFLEEKVLHLLLNCVRAGMNFVFGGEPELEKRKLQKFFMQFIPKESRVITIEDSLESIIRKLMPERMP